MKKKINRQGFALRNAYSSPMDMNPGVRKIVHVGNLRISSVLCVDAFPAEPVWHASGVLIDLKMQAKPLDSCSSDEVKILTEHLLGMLKTVGEGEAWTSQPIKLLHAYKKLSAAELSKLKKPAQKPEDFFAAAKMEMPNGAAVKIPDNMILKLKEDKEISTAARLEAEMTYMKIREPNPQNTEVIYMYPDLVRTKEDLFLFAMTYGMHLNGLNEGLRKVNPEVEKIFTAKNN